MIIFVKDMKNYILCFLSALLFSCAWPVVGFVPLIFFAFVPLFILARDLQKNAIPNLNKKFFYFSFLVFLLFNIASTYWIYYATLFGAIMAFFINSL